MNDNIRTVEVCFSPVSYPLFATHEAIVVIIDVLRATSAICTAIYHGVEGIIPVETVEEALEYHSKGYITAAERHGEIVDGFELGNSPFSYMDEKLKGKTVVLTTTNGTQAIHAARESYRVVIGSFLNLDVLSSWLIEQERDVLLLCAGWKNKFNLEDTLFAGAVIRRLFETGKYANNCDSARAAELLYRNAENDIYSFLQDSSHRTRLEKLNLEDDIKYCLTPNQSPAIPVLQGDVIKRLTLPELQPR